MALRYRLLSISEINKLIPPERIPIPKFIFRVSALP